MQSHLNGLVFINTVGIDWGGDTPSELSSRVSCPLPSLSNCIHQQIIETYNKHDR